MPYPYGNFSPNLRDSDECLAFATTELAEFGLALPGDAELELDLSAGVDLDGIKVYRPWVLMANILSRAPNTTHLSVGGGATFRNPDKTITGWLNQQVRVDAARRLTLPPGATISLGEPEPYSGPVRAIFRL